MYSVAKIAGFQEERVAGVVVWAVSWREFGVGEEVRRVRMLA